MTVDSCVWHVHGWRRNRQGKPMRGWVILGRSKATVVHFDSTGMVLAFDSPTREIGYELDGSLGLRRQTTYPNKNLRASINAIHPKAPDKPKPTLRKGLTIPVFDKVGKISMRSRLNKSLSLSLSFSFLLRRKQFPWGRV